MQEFGVPSVAVTGAPVQEVGVPSVVVTTTILCGCCLASGDIDPSQLCGRHRQTPLPICSGPCSQTGPLLHQIQLCVDCPI